MINVINVSSKGQIVIPEEVRKHLAITEGSKLVLLEREGTIILKKEEEVVKQLDLSEHKELLGWLAIAEKSLQDIWDNPKDEQVWKKYLSKKKPPTR